MFSKAIYHIDTEAQFAIISFPLRKYIVVVGPNKNSFRSTAKIKI